MMEYSHYLISRLTMDYSNQDRVVWRMDRHIIKLNPIGNSGMHPCIHD